MIRIVQDSSYLLVRENNRFDSRYYFMGEVLNEILSKFSVYPLSNFTNFIKKGIFDLNSRFYRDSGIPFLRISNLMSFTIDEKGLVYIPIENHQREIKTKLIPGDLALSKIGKYLGKIAQIPLRYDEVNISQNIIGVSFNCEDYIKKYIFLYLTTPLAINQIIRVSKQHNQNKLTLPDIRNLRIPLLPEQLMKKFAADVDKLAKLENESFTLIKKAKEKFYEYLRIDFSAIKSNRTFESSLKAIREESFFTPQYSRPLYNQTLEALSFFPTIPLHEIATHRKGDEVGSENYNLYVNKADNDIPFIRTSDIVNHEVDSYPDFFISYDIFESLAQEIEDGDILFSKDGSIGHTAMVTGSDTVIISSGFSILRIKDDSELSPEYVFLALALPEIGMYQAAKRTVIASTIPHIRPEHVLKIKIPVIEENYRDDLKTIVAKALQLKKKRKDLLSSLKSEIEFEFTKSSDR